MNYLMLLRADAAPPPEGEAGGYVQTLTSDLRRSGVLLEAGRIDADGPALSARYDPSHHHAGAREWLPSDIEPGVLAYWTVAASVFEEMEYWVTKYPPPPGTRIDVRALA